MIDDDSDQTAVSTVVSLYTHKIRDALDAMSISEVRKLIAEIEAESAPRFEDADLRA